MTSFASSLAAGGNSAVYTPVRFFSGTDKSIPLLPYGIWIFFISTTFFSINNKLSADNITADENLSSFQVDKEAKKSVSYPVPPQKKLEINMLLQYIIEMC
jgi:hypothetical protein